MNEIDPSRETVVHCKAGIACRAIEALKQAGFPGRLINLKGITAWSDEVDPSVGSIDRSRERNTLRVATSVLLGPRALARFC